MFGDRHGYGWILLLVISLTIVGLLLIGCAGFSQRLGFAGSSARGRMQYRYGFLSAAETSRQRLVEGQSLELSYNIVVEQGTLKVQVLDPERVPLWETEFHESTRDRVQLSVPRSGIYTIVAEGNDTSGRFDISWRVE